VKRPPSTTIQNIRGLDIYPPRHPRILKMMAKADSPEIHGDKVWFSSYFIMDFLDANPPAPKTRIMEIGCGWGLLSMYCTKNFKARALGVDADKNVFPFLELHAGRNDVKVKTKASRFENLKPKLLAKQDMILGGDICFWDELVEPLHTLIANAMEAGVKRIVIADPGRPPFLKLARRCRRLYKARLKAVNITKPRKHDGYLLIIDNPLAPPLAKKAINEQQR
jgi:predicted nicotinamide N-methyase